MKISIVYTSHENYVSEKSATMLHFYISWIHLVYSLKHKEFGASNLSSLIIMHYWCYMWKKGLSKYGMECVGYIKNSSSVVYQKRWPLPDHHDNAYTFISQRLHVLLFKILADAMNWGTQVWYFLARRNVFVEYICLPLLKYIWQLET